jgi:hypothetical protein
MDKSFSLGVKLAIFAVLAVAFGATVIALSMRDHSWNTYERVETTDGSSVLDRSFTVKAGDTFMLDADAGDVSILGVDGETLTVHVVEEGDREMVDKYHVSMDQEGSTVAVRGKFAKRFFRFWDDAHWQVRYEVRVPKSFNLELHTSGGDLEVQSVTGTVRGGTSGGNLSIRDLDGTIRLSTSGGDVRLTGCRGDMDLETSGGDIEGESLTGAIHVETSGGNIVIRDTDGKLYGSTSGGNIRAELKDNKGVELSTSGGNISLELPKSVAATVSAESTGGDVSCDFPFEGKLKDESLNGKINGGGNRIRLESSGGSISLSPTID